MCSTNMRDNRTGEGRFFLGLEYYLAAVETEGAKNIKIVVENWEVIKKLETR